jgi:uncharacterized protein YunC (DUF1805 family)
MIEADTVEISGSKYEYVKMPMFKAPLLLLKGKKGFVMCGYLNLEAANKLGDCAVRVSGVSDLQTLLDSKAAGVSDEAKKLGISEGQKVSDFIHLLA